jgi:hypothetical protein
MTTVQDPESKGGAAPLGRVAAVAQAVAEPALEQNHTAAAARRRRTKAPATQPATGETGFNLTVEQPEVLVGLSLQSKK